MKYISLLSSRSANALKRFPVASLWAIIGSLLCIVWLEVDSPNLLETYRNEILVLNLGVSWLIGTAFFMEQFATPRKGWFVHLLVLGLLLLYYLSLPAYSPVWNEEVLIRWVLYFLAGHVFLFFAPFTIHWSTAVFWNYLRNIFISLGRSIIFSLVLYLGLVFALLAIDALFEVQINSRLYGQLFVFCLGIVHTAVFLSTFPKELWKQSQVFFVKPLEVFVKYILVPLLALYLVILYLYSLKILLAWELPEGWVSNLICVLAILGFVVHIIIEPIRKTHSSFLIRKFFPWFYILLSPLLVLLFVAVFRRISDYNFTESRYFLLLLSFWILSMLAYLLFSRTKQLRVLPISLFLLLILSSFGPWGAFKVSTRAQLSEFRKLFSEITAEEKTITRAKADRFSSISRFLARRGQLEQTQAQLGFDPETAFKEFDTYSIGNKILDSLQVRIVDDSTSTNIFQSFSRDPKVPLIVELKEYDLFAELRVDSFQETDREAALRLRNESNDLELLREGKVVLRFSIQEKLLALLSKYGNIHRATPGELEFEFSNENGSFRIIFKELHFEMKKERPILQYASAYLFYKDPD